MTNDPSDKPRELFVTEFKNQFDVWQPLHATNSREKALNDAGTSGRVIHVIEYAAYQSAIERVKRLEEARDAYALAMAAVLRAGVFPDKHAVKLEIEEILKESP